MAGLGTLFSRMDRQAAWLTRVCVNHCISQRRLLRSRGWPLPGLIDRAGPRPMEDVTLSASTWTAPTGGCPTSSAQRSRSTTGTGIPWTSAPLSWGAVRERCERIWSGASPPFERSSKMIDIGPRLDSRLRDKFDRIDAETPPQSLLTFQPTGTRRRHGSLNVIVGVAAIAVVAAGIAHSHWNSAVTRIRHPRRRRRREGRCRGCPSTARLPHPRTSSPRHRCRCTGRGFPASWHIVIPVTKHTGSAALPPFIPEGWEYIQYACVGTGHLQIVSTAGTVSESLRPCSSSAHPVNAQIQVPTAR